MRAVSMYKWYHYDFLALVIYLPLYLLLLKYMGIRKNLIDTIHISQLQAHSYFYARLLIFLMGVSAPT